MLRTIVVCLSLGLLVTSDAHGRRPGERRGSRGPISQAALRHDLDAMTARLGGVAPDLAAGDRRRAAAVVRLSIARSVRSRLRPGRLRAQSSRSPADRSSGSLGPACSTAAIRWWRRRSWAATTRSAASIATTDGSTSRVPSSPTPARHVSRSAWSSTATTPTATSASWSRYALAYGTMAAYNGALLTPWNTPRDLPDIDPPQDRADGRPQADRVAGRRRREA